MITYQRKCKDCNRLFETDIKNKTICPVCCRGRDIKRIKQYNDENYKASKGRRRVSTYNVMPVRKFVILLDRYNEKHGTRYTYGQAMQHLANGAIDEKEFYSSEVD